MDCVDGSAPRLPRSPCLPAPGSCILLLRWLHNSWQRSMCWIERVRTDEPAGSPHGRVVPCVLWQDAQEQHDHVLDARLVRGRIDVFAFHPKLRMIGIDLRLPELERHSDPGELLLAQLRQI